MAWILRARPPVAELKFGRLVRATELGVFEGTWVGDSDDLAPLRSTTTFGSGVLLDDRGLRLIAPGHMLEGIYVCRRDTETIASNSFPGLLAVAGLELDQQVAYPGLFNESVDGVLHTRIPTRTDYVDAYFHENLLLDLDGRLTVVSKPREQTFTSFPDYRSRLSDAFASALANAPSFEPVVTVSSGYDGAAVAVLASELGCRRVATVREGKPVQKSSSLDDSGETVGKLLGMDVETYERLAYLRRDDLPEAEFLASGFTGEDVALSDLEGDLSGRMLVTAFFGDGMWWMNRPPRPTLWRSDQSGSSLGEWRLRVGFVHVPLPCVGGEQYRITQRISRLPEMRPWVIGRAYDKPIPRRILEEAGIPRRAFGQLKRAVSSSIHVDGPAVLAPATRAALEAFADKEGSRVELTRRTFPTWQRAILKASRKLGVEPLARRVERRKHALGVMEPKLGSLLLRWAVSVVRPRYE